MIVQISDRLAKALVAAAGVSAVAGFAWWLWVILHV